MRISNMKLVSSTDSDTEMLFGIEFNQKHVVSTLYKLLSMFAAYKMQTFFLRDNAPVHTVIVFEFRYKS